MSCNSDPGLQQRGVDNPQSPRGSDGVGGSAPNFPVSHDPSVCGPPPVSPAALPMIPPHVRYPGEHYYYQPQPPPPVPWDDQDSGQSQPSGYDYLFQPVLEAKYECPICLMCLRDPVQTECGHRFCRNCIVQCLRDAGLRCPVDNEPLTENQIFSDVCVKREIMDLKAQCPFDGCPELVELRIIENHKEVCTFRTEPCPNRCGAAIRRKSTADHIHNECPKRLVDCSFCMSQFPLDKFEDHVLECPKVPVTCEFCQQSVLREEVYHHHDQECTKVLIACQFAEFGCSSQVMRDKMDAHCSSNMQHHMTLLAHHLRNSRLQTQLSDSYGTLRADMGDYSPPQSWRMGAAYNSTGGYPSAANKIADIEEYGAKKLDQEKLGRTQKAKVGASPGPGSQSPGLSVPHAMPPPSFVSIGPHIQDFGEVFTHIQTLKDKVKDLQEKEVWTKQKLLELESNNKRKDSEIKRLQEKVEGLQRDVKDIREHVANGVFVWRLHGYKDLRRAAEQGEATVRHSDGFYTSSCGYRLCIRVNINNSETRNMTFISLFVHFMQGKYDDFLVWPFRGTITLSIVDQNEDSSKRKNISETLQAKSSLDAFKRPKTIRNHKGFGYMEFASVDFLERDGGFVKEDMVLIKVEVNSQS